MTTTTVGVRRDTYMDEETGSLRPEINDVWRLSRDLAGTIDPWLDSGDPVNVNWNVNSTGSHLNCDDD